MAHKYLTEEQLQVAKKALADGDLDVVMLAGAQELLSRVTRSSKIECMDADCTYDIVINEEFEKMVAGKD